MEDACAGVSKVVVEALDAMSKTHAGREALVLAGKRDELWPSEHLLCQQSNAASGAACVAGAVDVLQGVVEERRLDDLAAQDTAAGLLVALRVQQDHVE